MARDFNVTKCAIMSLTTRKPSVQVYTMGNQPIPRAQKHDYIGVTMSANLSWNNQCNKVCNKAKRTLGLVKCTLYMLLTSGCAKQHTRCSFDHPWSTQPALGHHTHRKVPNIWRRFCELLPDLCVATTGHYNKTSSVTQMMNKLNWDTLATRRLCRDATMVYKLVHQKVGIPLPDFIVRGDLRTRGSTHKFRIIRTKCILFQKSFYPRCISLWNSCQSQL